ncbi:MAG TPA: alpha/beta fold hydrolase [Pirellulales bacterium]|nr:alpha/beta fold hydrolase [Pirellulales bacterium]
MSEKKQTNVALIIIGVVVGAGLLMMCLCGVGAMAFLGIASRANVTVSPHAVSPPLTPQAEDYAVARRSFSTKLRRTGPSPQPAAPNFQVHGAEPVSYRSGDLSLTAYVDPPPADGQKRPAVLFLHGGFAFGDGDLEMAQPYRDAGYVVMEPVLRGENGQPGNFTLFFDEVEDVLGAADALRNLSYVDADRVYVAGHSAGGTLAMLAAMASDKFRAAAAFSGSPDAGQLVRDLPHLSVFDTSDIRELQIRSPSVYGASFKCPARLYYGAAEGWAAASTAQTANLARGSGIDVEAVLVPGDHFSSVPDAIRRSIEFFRSQSAVRSAP